MPDNPQNLVKEYHQLGVSPSGR